MRRRSAGPATLALDTDEVEEEILEYSKECSKELQWYTPIADFFCPVKQDDTGIVQFNEFEPAHFRRVRLSAGLTDELYRSLFLERVKERLTQGGASGAFFFFSKDEFLIAKSCTPEDISVLVENAKSYADYMTSNEGSYISKVYGAYMLRIYGSELYFMVMNNIFLNDRQHHNLVKYDIKGSWESRNATIPRDGDRVTCKFCEQKYVFKKVGKGNSKRGRLLSRSNSGFPNINIFSSNSTLICRDV